MINNQVKWGSILSYMQMAISIIINLVYTPVMIRLLGQNEYGLYNTVASTISMISIISIGFNSGYIKFYAIYKKDNDKKAIEHLNGMFMEIFIIIGLIALVCGMYLSFNLNIVFDCGLSTKEYETAKVLMILLTINLAVSFPMSVFSNIITANEKFIFFKIIAMIRTVCGPLVILPLLLMGYRSIAMVAVTVLFSLLTDTVYSYYVIFKLKNRFEFGRFDRKLFIGMFSYTFFIALNAIIDQINWNVDKILLGRYRGTGEVALYSVGFTLYNCYMLFSTSISGVFTPRIHKLVANTRDNPEEQKKQLTSLFIKVGRLQFLVLGIVFTGVVFFGKAFITEIWAGKSYGKAYYVALLLILPATIALIQNLGIEIQRAENKHQFRSIVYLAMALINLFLSVVLCQIYGAIGSAIGTAIALVLANGLIMNIYYSRKCNLDIRLFWKNILIMSKGLIIPVVIGIIEVLLIDNTSIYVYFIAVIMYSISYVLSTYFLSMNEYEKGLVYGPLKILTNKVKKLRKI